MDWYSNPEFWSLHYDWMFPPQSFVDAVGQVEKISQLCGTQSGAVLDLCCGPGRHSVPLANSGYQVTAVDLDAGLLERARGYAAEEGVAVEFVQANMLEFLRPAAFDLVISMYSSFGYFPQREDDQRVLGNCRECLRPGGKLLVDVRGKEIHAMNHVDTLSVDAPEGARVFQHSRVTDDWSRTVSEWVHVKDGRATSFEVAFNLYSAAELRALLEQAGFAHVQVYGSLDGTPYDQRASRLVVVATTPDQC